MKRNRAPAEVFQEAARHIDRITRTTHDVLWYLALPSRELYLTQAFSTIWGRSVEELYADPSLWMDTIHPEDRQRTLNAMGRILEEPPEELNRLEYRIVRPDGGVRWVHDRISRVLDDDGGICGICGTISDITERKKAEDNLKFQANALAQISDAVVAWDLDHRITYWNPAAAALYEHDAETVIGRPVSEVLELDIPAPAAASTPPQVSRFTTVSGRRLHVEIKTRTFHDDRGELIGTLTVHRDVTDRVGLERTMREAQKMEAIGRLAGGIAHDFNNLFMGMMGCCQMASKGLPQGTAAHGYVDELFRSIERGASLTRQLLAFSRPDARRRRVLDLNEIISAASGLLRSLPRAGVCFQISRAATHPIEADPGQIEQILFNLVSNARDAMPRGGRLLIETADTQADGGLYVRLTVQDTGEGMDTNTREHAYEPFFSTKETPGNAGLGLAIVYGIVQNLGGHIDFRSESGRGTRIDVFFPASTVTRAESAPDPDLNTTLRLQTLLVEDDSLVRLTVRRFLEDLGHAVTEAEDAEQALETFRSSSDGFSLLLTDIVLPGMDGYQLATRLLEKQPDIVVLCMSAYPGDSAERANGSNVALPLLRKPFDQDELSQALERLGLDVTTRPATEPRAGARDSHS